ncbi:hypothetical protein HPB49_008685 [Dermacentor silvarum]|uniref:Uncharacterized protein n=1 Tax=Dermacentor silvarum TaxID=543639 RepID=A0ACB8DC06_DERSI|nr:hypothetical protein HPB49_008685 [Dermacentor silvarum]
MRTHQVKEIEAPEEEDDDWECSRAITASFMCLVFLMLLIFMLLFGLSRGTTPRMVPYSRDRSRTTPSERLDRPMNPNYVRRDLRGLVCHTDAVAFLGSAPPDSCDFVMVDVQVSSPQPHPTYSYMATIRTNPGTFQAQIAQRIQSFPDKALLLAFKRSVLRSGSLQPSAVARGVVQMVVDMDAHGVALSDEQITEADTSFISRDAQVLSDEVQSYHGLIRYDVFNGNRSALRSLMLDVMSKPSITFVYRVSGISRTFTHPYFDNFYTEKLNEKNLSSIIDEDLAQPLSAYAGSKSVAISMTLMARMCPKDTMVSFNTYSNCVSFPMDVAHVRLILQQLEQARALPVAFIIEHYEMEAQGVVTYYDVNNDVDVPCGATPFGFTAATKAELVKF